MHTSSYSDMLQDFLSIPAHYRETVTSSMLWEMDRKLLIQGLTCGLMAVVFNSVSPSCDIKHQSVKPKRPDSGDLSCYKWIKNIYQLLCWSLSVFPTCKRSLNLADVLMRSDRQLSILAWSPEPAPWLNNLEQSFCREARVGGLANNEEHIYERQDKKDAKCRQRCETYLEVPL